MVSRGSRLILWGASLTFAALLSTSHPTARTEPRKPRRVIELKGVSVGLSEPALVARSAGYLWFPTLSRLDNGDLLAIMSDYADMHVKKGTARAAWSRDGARSWGKTAPALYGDVSFRLPGGDHMLLPYYLYPAKGGMKGPCQIIPKGKREVVDKGEVEFTGWPRPDRTFEEKLGLAGFVTNGQVVPLKAGGYLGTASVATTARPGRSRPRCRPTSSRCSRR